VRDVTMRAQAAVARDLCASGGLRVLRTSGGLTLIDLAEMVEAEAGFPVAASVVSRWERGLMLPGPRRAPALFAVAEALSGTTDAEASEEEEPAGA
jgi:transcriptional regulator with XRE-family HTH domain